MPNPSPLPPLPLPPFVSHPHSTPDNDALHLSAFEEWLNEYLKQFENATNDNPVKTESPLDFRNAIFHYISNLKQVILNLNTYIANHLDTDFPQSKVPEPIQQQALSLTNKRRKVTQGFLRAARQEQAKTRRDFRRSEGNLERVTNERDEARFELRRLSKMIARLEEENQVQEEKNLRLTQNLTDLHSQLTTQRTENWATSTHLQTLQSRNHRLQRVNNQLQQALTDKTIEIDVLVEESQNWSHERANLMLENISLKAKLLTEEDVNQDLERILTMMAKGMDRMNGLRREVLQTLKGF